MRELTVGIDDTATATQKSEGWAFIVVPPHSVSALQSVATPLAGGKSFHGSECKKRNIRKYERFLIAVRDAVASHEPSFLAHVFDDPSWHTDLKQIGQTVVSTGKVQIDPAVEAAVNHVMPPLMTLQRITARQKMANDEVEVWVDECGTTQGFAAMKVGTSPVPISAAAYTKALYNGYRKIKFPTTPQMAIDGLHVVPDNQSILIQAADVFGNFAAAYAAWKLGNADRQWKGEVFGRIFDNPDISTLLPHLSLHGDHLEVSLQAPGVLQLIVS